MDEKIRNQGSVGPGSYVYGRLGEYLGRVEGFERDRVRVRGPLPYSRLYFIPVGAIAHQMAGGRELFLDCTVEQVAVKGWQHLPPIDLLHPAG